MSNDDNILEDLEVTDGDDVTGAGPGIDGQVAGERLRAGENNQGGWTVEAGGAEVETKRRSHRGNDGTQVTARAAGQKAEVHVRDLG